MSIKHQVPRQDRRGFGRSPVKPHGGKQSVGTNNSTGAGSAPGANGPPTTGASPITDDED